VAGLARADGVEEPEDRDGQTALLVVGQGEELVEQLAGGVRPAADAARSDDDVVLLVLREGLDLAVDLGGRGEQGRTP